MDKLVKYQDAAGEWRWRRVAPNNEILSSGEGHGREEDVDRAAWRANPDLAGTSIELAESRMGPIEDDLG